MSFSHYSRNLTLEPIEEASVSLFSVEFTYGFGVYESIRVKKGKPLFLGQHAERLLSSAAQIDLEHELSLEQIKKAVNELVAVCDEPLFNLKLLLIGGRSPQDADLYILPLMPTFIDKKLYKTGAKAISVEYERYLPKVKSLNMLPSYLAYRDAKKAGAYDALLINQSREVTEGTRTNFFAIKGREIITPPLDEVLEGVTLTNVIKVAKDNGFTVMHQPIPYDSLKDFDSLFITSTSSKIMPLSQVDDLRFEISDELHELMKCFSDFLKQQD